MMRIGRTVPPAAAPLAVGDIVAGVRGLLQGGSTLIRLADEMQAFFQADGCFLVSSGKAALTAALLALREIRPGRSTVLIPAYTCYSVPAAIVRAGLRVDLCDIDPCGFDFDFRQLSRKVENPDLLCLVSTHLFGLPADVARARKLVIARGIPIVEDAAQAFGEEVDAVKLGTIGDIGIFSFGRGKAICAVEGGMVVTAAPGVTAAVRRQVAKLPRYGLRQTLFLLLQAVALHILIRPSCFWLPKSVPALRLGETIFDPGFPLRRMSPFQAGLLRRWETRLVAFRGARRRNVQFWCDTLAPAQKRLRFPDRLATLLRLPVVLPDRETAASIVAESERRGLGVAPGYPDSIAGIPALRRQFAAEDFPRAREMARRLVTLPVHPLVSRRDRQGLAALLHATGQLDRDGEG